VLSAGAILNETYELIEPLGRGGMGEVWKARHLRLPKEVALKVLASSVEDSAEVMARFRREAEITSRLGHPHIVEVLDFNVLPDGRAYLVMELLKGETLRQCLKKGLLSLHESLNVLAQVSSALQAAHGASVVHRDLNPSNIFLTWLPGPAGPELCVKVLDFGISKIQGSETLVTRDNSVMGTPAYMSPEQARGLNSEIDARSDQFALATIGYEMLSGQRPFAGESMAESVHKVVYEETPSLRKARPDLAEHLVAAIERAMAKEPRRRFPDIGAFLSALQGGTAAAPDGSDATLAPVTVASPARARPLTERPVARRHELWIVVLGLVLAVAGVVVATLVGRKPEPPSREAAPDSSRPRPDSRSDGRSFADARRAPADSSRPDGPRALPARKGHVHWPVAQDPLARDADFLAAQAALGKGEYDAALRLSQRVLYTYKGDELSSSRVFALRASAYCGQRDLGNAKAMLRRVKPQHQRKARELCARLGQSL